MKPGDTLAVPIPDIQMGQNKLLTSDYVRPPFLSGNSATQWLLLLFALSRRKCGYVRDGKARGTVHPSPNGIVVGVYPAA